MSDKLSFNQVQGYLLANAYNILDATGRDDEMTKTDIEADFSSGFQPTIVKKVVGGDTGDNTSELMNAFSSINATDFVTDLPDEVRVQLRPRYKIYKTLVFDEGRRINLELKSSILGENTISNPGVVVKNIEITNLGGNLEEINSNIDVTISLYATKLDQFFEKQYPSPIKNARFTTPQTARKTIQNGVSWIDLLKLNLQDLDLSLIEESMRQINLSSRETKQQILSEIPIPYINKEADQRIRLEIYYNDIEDIEGYSQDQINYIRSLVAAQREVLELSLVANEVTFNPDGTSELTIQFRASHGTDIIDRRTDLFYDPFIEDLNLQLDDELALLNILIQNDGVDAAEIDSVRYVLESHKTFEFFNFSRNPFTPQTIRLGPDEELEGKISFKNAELERNPDGENAIQRRANQYAPLIAERQEAKKKLFQYQAGLLVRGLYGPTLFLTQFSHVPGSNQRSSENIQNAIASASVEDSKSRVYLRYPYINDVVNTNQYIAKGQTDDFTVTNSYDGLKDAQRDLANLSDANAYKDRVDKKSQELGEPEETPSGPQKITNNRTEVEFVFFGDIIEVALEVLASNNRYGSEKKDFENKIKAISPQIVVSNYSNLLRDTVRGMNQKYLYSYVRPFYSTFGAPSGKFEELEGLRQQLAQEQDSAAPEYIRSQQVHDSITQLEERVAELGEVISQTLFTNDARVGEVYQNIGEILMSEIQYTDPSNPLRTKNVNIADIPISLGKFTAWFNETVFARKRSVFFLRDYINQLMLFLRNILAERYSDTIASDTEPPEPLVNRLFVKAPTYDFLSSLTNSEKTFANNDVHISDIRQLSTNLSQNSSIYTKPLTIISESPSAIKPMRNNANRRTVDRSNNIPHIIFGDATNGILQDITFSKIDMPGVREARLLEGSRLYYGEDFVGPNILSERYNATLQLIGTTFFRPTSIFYLDPRPLELGYAKNVASPARLLGLGGYYVIIRVVQTLNFVGSATWNTTVETVWESFGDETSIGGSVTKTGQLQITSFNGRLAISKDAEREELPSIIYRDDGVRSNFTNTNPPDGTSGTELRKDYRTPAPPNISFGPGKL